MAAEPHTRPESQPEDRDWRIRTGRPEDQTQVLGLTPRLADFELPPWRSAEEITEADHALLRRTLHMPEAGHFLLVAENSRLGVAGCALVSVKRDFYTRIRHAHLEVIAIAPEAEGRGLGSTLLAEAEFRAQAAGLPFMTLNVFTGNQRARSFYESRDYRLETLSWRKSLEDSAEEEAVVAPEGVRIDSGSQEDADALLALSDRLADFELPPWRSEREIANCKDGMIMAALDEQNPGRQSIFVARHGKEILGMALISEQRDFFTGDRHGHLEVLVVSPEVEGTGVGSALLGNAERQLREAGYPFSTLGLFAANHRARDFYTRHGYVAETLGYRKPLEYDTWTWTGKMPGPRDGD